MRITFFLVLFVCLQVIGLAQINAADREAVKVRQIVAHRGASAERPECTLAALRRTIEVKATAAEVDVRTSKDGQLFLLHDATLDRTTDGQGIASERTLAELQKLDAGSWFDAKYRNERIPTLREALELCRTRIDLLLDLKEQGDGYAKAVAREVRAFGDPKRIIVGVRSAAQARRFRELLPTSRQIGLVPDPNEMEAFAKAGVETIRLWPKWLADKTLVARVRRLGVKLHLNGSKGTPQEVLPLLIHAPDSMSADDPAAVVATLAARKRHDDAINSLGDLLDWEGDSMVVPWVSQTGAVTFLNRDYAMLEIPEYLQAQPRVLFAGGEGDQVALRFKKPATVLAAFEYNNTGAWSFPDGGTPLEFGWRLLQKDAYRGASNGNLGGKPHHASIYYRQFDAGQQLSDMPPWWLCLAVMEPREAKEIPGLEIGLWDPPRLAPRFSYERWAESKRTLAIPPFESDDQWRAWQEQRRREFRDRLVFPYSGDIVATAKGEAKDRGKFVQQQFEVACDGQRLFRFFRLSPHSAIKKTPTIVCFMGHGEVKQVLEDRGSYQHACAAQFAERGYLVFAMENVGMEPSRDTHHELDRLLRLDGHSWYSLLFAHQQLLLRQVFEDRQADPQRVGVTGVSTGGLLALSAIAMEPRVRAASVQGIFGSMRVSFIRDRDRHCRCGAIPGLLPKFDLPEMAMLAAPRSLHFSNAKNDGFGPAEARRCVELISPRYRRAGGKTPEFSEPAGNHEYAFGPALGFFERTIGKPE